MLPGVLTTMPSRVGYEVQCLSSEKRLARRWMLMVSCGCYGRSAASRMVSCMLMP